MRNIREEPLDCHEKIIRRKLDFYLYFLLISRPIFVYKNQEIKREKVKEQKTVDKKANEAYKNVNKFFASDN